MSAGQVVLGNLGLTGQLITTIPSSDTISQGGGQTFATTLSIPGTSLQVGSVITIRAHGTYVTGATASPQMAFQINAGGTSGAAPAPSAATIGTGINNAAWTMECFIQINTVGASGTAICWGEYIFANNVNGAQVIGNNRIWPVSATFTYNTTGSQTVSIQQTGTLVTGQTFTLLGLQAEVRF